VGEINELRGLHTKDQESIKAWVSRTHEKWVPKFKEFATSFPRRCVLFGTTNRTDILADETGNRRWLPLHVRWVKPALVAQMREQLWAEGAALFRGLTKPVDAGPGPEGGEWVGGVAWRAAEALGKAEHGAYMRHDEWEGVFTEWLGGCDGLDSAVASSTGAARGDAPFTVADVLGGALGIPLKDMDARVQMRAGSVLRGLGFERRQNRVAGVRAWRWERVTPVTPVSPLRGDSE
jgi:hypothetical protein